MKEETRIFLLLLEKRACYFLSLVRRVLNGKVRMQDGKLRDFDCQQAAAKSKKVYQRS